MNRSLDSALGNTHRNRNSALWGFFFLLSSMEHHLEFGFMPPMAGIIGWKSFKVGSLWVQRVLEQMLIHRDLQEISGIEDPVLILQIHGL